MTYKEKIIYLKLTESKYIGKPIPEDINKRYTKIKEEVLKLDLNIFNVLYHMIINEKTNLDFLKNKKDDSENEEIFINYLDNEILKHQNNIKSYGEQILRLYSRDTIIDIFEKRKQACQRRIDVCNLKLNMNPSDRATLISLEHEQDYLNQLNNLLDISKGSISEMIDSYVDVSFERRKL